ncbi:MAG: ribonuclease VapC [Alphaproteobacteria bacterium]|nr:MAG: ribonuclease VapC [Alphaproteobacteria bacterium]
MTYLVDTDVLSLLRRRDRSPVLQSWFAARRSTDLFISAVSIGEIERGIALVRRRDDRFAHDLAAWLDRLLGHYGDRILPFDLGAARRWGRLSAMLGNDGADLQIAATALENGLTVVSRNVGHFAPAGVPVVDPLA